MKHTTLILAAACLFAGACSSHRYTAHDASDVQPARGLHQVTVSATLPADTYRETGILEVVADSYADAHAHFKRLGAENGCHAVRPFTTRTAVFGGPNVTVSETIYLGACLVPRSS